jgi:hypothetical protein
MLVSPGSGGGDSWRQALEVQVEAATGAAWPRLQDPWLKGGDLPNTNLLLQVDSAF